MYLKELIEELKKHDPKKRIRNGFRHPHSYRGYYDQLAFEPAENVTVGEMLACAEAAMGATYEGYKGGDYKMGEWTEVNLASYGSEGDQIGRRLLAYMLADAPNAKLTCGERSELLGAAHGSDSGKEKL